MRNARPAAQLATLWHHCTDPSTATQGLVACTCTVACRPGRTRARKLLSTTPARASQPVPTGVFARQHLLYADACKQEESARLRGLPLAARVRYVTRTLAGNAFDGTHRASPYVPTIQLARAQYTPKQRHRRLDMHAAQRCTTQFNQ